MAAWSIEPDTSHAPSHRPGNVRVTLFAAFHCFNPVSPPFFPTSPRRNIPPTANRGNRSTRLRKRDKYTHAEALDHVCQRPVMNSTTHEENDLPILYCIRGTWVYIGKPRRLPTNRGCSLVARERSGVAEATGNQWHRSRESGSAVNTTTTTRPQPLLRFNQLTLTPPPPYQSIN